MESYDRYCAVFYNTNMRLVAEEKYLLLRVLYLYGSVRVGSTVEALEGRLGMSDAVLKKARDGLVAKSYFVEQPCITDDDVMGQPSRRGRYRKGFQVSAQCLADLDAQSGDSMLARMKGSMHLSKIAQLLFWGDRHVPGDQHREMLGRPAPELDKLRPVTRVLLTVLLALADAGGVVRGVGLGTIGRMVGIEKDRLEYQLSKLVALGYLMAKVPGVTGRYLFGRAAGGLFLDINHGAFSKAVPQAIICLQGVVNTDPNDFTNGYRLFSTAATSRGNRQQSAQKLQRTAIPFMGRVSPLAPGVTFNRRGVSADIEITERLGVDQDYGRVAQPRGEVLTSAYDLFKAPPDEAKIMHATPASESCEELFDGSGRATEQSLLAAHELYWLFQDKPLDAFARYWQYKIEEYAAGLLSEYWELVDCKPAAIADSVLSKIHSEIYPLQLSGCFGPGVVVPDDHLVALSLFTYLIALRMALAIKLMITEIPRADLGGRDPAKARYTILPSATLGNVASEQRYGLTMAFNGEAQLPKKIIRVEALHNFGKIKRYVATIGYEVDEQEQQKFWLHAPGVKVVATPAESAEPQTGGGMS